MHCCGVLALGNNVLIILYASESGQSSSLGIIPLRKLSWRFLYALLINKHVFLVLVHDSHYNISILYITIYVIIVSIITYIYNITIYPPC